MAGLYKLVLVQHLHTQDISNVFHYLAGGNDSTCVQLANIFIQNVLPSILGVQTTDVVTIAVSVAEILLGAESCLDEIQNAIGTRGGSALPSHDAWSFLLSRSTAATRSGGKRIGGIAEADQEDGLSVAGIDTALNNLGNVFAEIYDVVAQDAIYLPVIVGFQDPLIFINPIAAGLYKRISTQGSRKRGTNSVISLGSPLTERSTTDFLVQGQPVNVMTPELKDVDLLLEFGALPPYSSTKTPLVVAPLP